MSWSNAAVALRSALEVPESEGGLAPALLAIALGPAVPFDAAEVAARLDAYGAEVREILLESSPGAPPPSAAGAGMGSTLAHRIARREIAALNTVLIERARFCGNTDDYYALENSLLPVVLERRVGLPIVLCAIYVETARRAGIPIVGVGFPGHFLVKHEGVTPSMVIDPYDGGKLLSLGDCQRLLDGAYGQPMPFRIDLLRRASRREIALRVLRNLQRAYLHREEVDLAEKVLDCLLEVEPEDPAALSDRGALRHGRGELRGALADYTVYLRVAPDGARKAEIAGNMALIRGKLTRLN